jgi:hypothetical protein
MPTTTTASRKNSTETLIIGYISFAAGNYSPPYSHIPLQPHVLLNDNPKPTLNAISSSLM